MASWWDSIEAAKAQALEVNREAAAAAASPGVAGPAAAAAAAAAAAIASTCDVSMRRIEAGDGAATANEYIIRKKPRTAASSSCIYIAVAPK